MDLDLFDKKILHTLNQDVRATYTTIGKKVRLSKEVVNYRIKRLEKEGIIKAYVTIFGFGYWAYKVLIDFAKITQQREQEILTYLKNNPHVNWITPCSGGWDLVFAVMAKNPQQFDTIFREIINHLGNNLQNYKIATSIGSNTFGHTYLLGTTNQKKENKTTTREKNFDEKDKKIAQNIQTNARAKIVDLHKKTHLPPDTIIYRLKKMEEQGIIKRYRLILNPSKLGYNRHEIFLRCTNLTDEVINKFRNYARNNPNIEFFSRCTGAWDIEMTIHLKTNDELRTFILEVKQQFGNYIQNFETVTLFETYNYVYLPEELR
ncbi:MAG: Lrp/AsnC family transcriptional regulator [Nanoarchaeota archaeon]|nr:Lrp/AsnC family transcriptional regulator [Nanoarchaeota archaeon]